MDVSQARKLKAREENARLKRLLAQTKRDQCLGGNRWIVFRFRDQLSQTQLVEF